MAESTERDPADMNIYQRIHAVMGDLPAIEPDKSVTIKNQKAYDYISHDAVTKAVQPKFSEHGIMVLPTIKGHAVNGNRTELTVSVDFVNIDNPDDRVTVESIGYGCDSSDKGPGKAFSYAVKYAYLKLLMLNSGDDVEGADVAHDPDTKRESQVAASDEQKRKAYEASANTYKAALQGATTVKECRDLKRANESWLTDAPKVTQEYFENLFRERVKALEETESEAA